ncbi:MAG: AmmeMemoRadiSam system protein B [Candidatus Omnitrophota bacterium]|nr:AmmeMemoRadiSam system protein B [Candidatus Omnitrophota bacterium]
MIRYPAVAGRFYPNSRVSLTKEIEKYVEKNAKRLDATGALLPHAGYIYSGPVAGAVISRLKPRDSFVILGPNHTGQGKSCAIMTKGKWKTPLGDVEIDTSLAEKILENSSCLFEDHQAHTREHSIEVQLPFLQYFQPDVKIVPIAITEQDSRILKKTGLEIARAIIALKKNSIILASSDMTHYEPQESAEKKDTQVINAVLQLDEDMLLKKVYTLGISMCGCAATVTMLAGCKKLGAKSGRLVKYQTSGEVNGDYQQVVGYAGIVIT